MRYIAIYGSFAILIGVLYFMNKNQNKGVNLKNPLQRVRSMFATQKDESEAVVVLNEMYQEFMFAMDDLKQQIQTQDTRIKALEEENNQLKTGGKGTVQSPSAEGFTVRELAETVGVGESTIRKWERDFAFHIPAPSVSSGTKRYDENALSVFLRIKFLRDQKMGFEEINAQLNADIDQQEETVNNTNEHSYAEQIRTQLRKGNSPEAIAKNLGVSVTEIEIIQRVGASA